MQDVPNGPVTLLLVIMTVAMMAALAWWLLGVPARMAPRATLQFALGNALLAGSALLSSLRGDEPSYLFYPLSDLAGVAALALLREGVQRLLHAHATTLQNLLIVAVAGACMFAVEPAPASRAIHGLIFNSASALLALQTFSESGKALRGEFGPLAAYAGGLVFGLFGVASLSRAVMFTMAVIGDTPMPGASSMNTYTTYWVFLLLLLALNISLMALLLLRLIGRIQRLAVRDPLTGVLNRRALEARISAETAREHKRQEAFAVVLFDLDHFKSVNDHLGHAGGDAALKHATEVIGRTLRDIDALGRLGGEEFVAVLASTDATGALKAAERMRAALEATPMDWNGIQHPLTASFGVCVSTGVAAQDEALLKRADDAMYRAKSLGRNRVEVAAPLTC